MHQQLFNLHPINKRRGEHGRRQQVDRHEGFIRSRRDTYKHTINIKKYYCNGLGYYALFVVGDQSNSNIAKEAAYI